MLEKDKKLLENIELVVQETILESNYSLEYICKSLYLSRSQLHRRIKSITGLSTTYYIRKIRLLKSQDLLKNPTLKVNEIATIVGINSSQNFSKYFKQEFGLTPTRYKQMYCKNNVAP